ncbi:protein kinase [Lysobacter koreensis]|uniref:Protein kinase n=1 Tax=Lysobacter koreensis TaxID=266122 RepID=A0ABW2YLK6_9GAMM
MNASPPAEPPSRPRGLAQWVFGPPTPRAAQQDARAAGAPHEGPDLDDPAQRQFGDYELLELIGQGGMGLVYRARANRLQREVAIKLLSAGPWASPEFIASFQEEARHAATLQHPGIVTVYEMGEVDGLVYYAMELVRGQSLAHQLAAGGPWPAREAAALVRTIAEAVDYAHSVGVLHLDLKPGNVLLDGHDQPKVADFGLARRLERDGRLDNLRISGTPNYMAPEQGRLGGGGLSRATDIWGLGAILYETLTGHPPFEASDDEATLRLLREGTVRRPSRQVALPADLEAICLKCLARQPGRRYASARALADDLGRFLEGRPVGVRPLNAAQRTARWARREPILAITAGAALLALLIGLGATTHQWQRAKYLALGAQAYLWAQRHETAWRLFEEQRGYAALSTLADNLVEQEAVGATSAAAAERTRIGIARQQMPQLFDAIDVGARIHVLALSPDGRYVALGLDPFQVALYEVASGRQRWRVALAMHSPVLDGQLRRLRFTPDGKYLLVDEHWYLLQIHPAGYQQYRVAIADGRQTAVPNAAQVVSETWSDDGRHVVLLDQAAGYRLYRAPRAGDEWRPLGPRVERADAQFRPGWLLPPKLAFIAMNTPTRGIELLDPRTLQARHRIAAAGLESRFVAWAAAPDGRWLALGRADGEVVLVDARDGRQRQLQAATGSEADWLSFSADGRRLAASMSSGDLHVWSVPDGARFGVALHGPDELWGHQLACDPRADTCTVLAMQYDRVSMWAQAGSGPHASRRPVPVAPEISHHAYIPRFASAFDLRHGVLATGGQEGNLRLWRLPRSPVLGALAPTQRESDLHFDGRHLVGIDGHTAWVFDADTGAPRSPALHLPQPVGFAALSPDSRVLVASAGRALHVFDWRRGRLLLPPIVLAGTPVELAISPDGRRVLTRTMSPQRRPANRARLQVHELASGRPLGAPVDTWYAHGRFSPDGQQLLVTEELGSRLHALDDLRRPLREFPAPADTVATLAAFDPARGEVVQALETLNGGVRNRLQRWSLRDGRLQQTLALNARAEDLRVDPGSGRIAISGNPGGSAISDRGVLLDRQGRRTPIANTRQDGLARAQALSSDGRMLAQALFSGVILIDPVDGRPLGPPLRVPLRAPDVVAQLAFSPDGRRLVARTFLGRWLLWRIEPDPRPLRRIADEAQLLSPLASSRFQPPSPALRAALRGDDPGIVAAPLPRPSPWSCLSARIPSRQAGTPSRLVDLSRHYTAPLADDAMPSYQAARPARLGNLCALPVGRQTLQGIDYDLRGLMQVPGPGDPADRGGAAPSPAPTPIAVAPGRYRRLHVLGALNAAPVGDAKDAAPVAQVVFHYRDGSRAAKGLRTSVSGQDGGPWRDWPDVSLAWLGSVPEHEITPFAVAMLYATRIDNPHPDRELVALEIRRTLPLEIDGTLVVVALTLE